MDVIPEKLDSNLDPNYNEDLANQSNNSTPQNKEGSGSILKKVFVKRDDQYHIEIAQNNELDYPHDNKKHANYSSIQGKTFAIFLHNFSKMID